MKKILIIVIFLAVVFFLGKNLNPFDFRIFTFHDATQAARISEFAFNIKSGMIPPRIAPHLSFGLGFPVFNYYAPFAYWLTSLFHLIGLSIPMALKLSFFLSIIVAFIGMSIFLNLFFNKISSLLGAVLYAGSTWFAVEIFVRGNLSEVWFIALFPIVLFLLYKNTKKLSNILLIISIIFISFIFTSHNVLSLLSLLILGSYVCFFPHKKRGFFILASALLVSSYFLIPALLESNLTYATEVAKKTNYQDHFLCIKQLWQAKSWEFGGSGKGCENDGMPFILGKLPILLSLIGIFIFLYDLIKKKIKILSIATFVLFLTLISIFLTLYQSSFIWQLLSPILSLFQFPWRFLVFSMFGIGFFGAYVSNKINKRFSLFVIPLIFFLLFSSNKYFSKPWLMSYDEYKRAYLTKNYISKTVAYNMAEYLPQTANYSYWRNYDSQIYPAKDMDFPITENSPIEITNSVPYTIISNNAFSKKVFVEKQSNITINIHYFPFWKININNIEIIPSSFDLLGRPVIHLTTPSTVSIYYHETSTEILSNAVSLISFLLLSLILLFKPLWNKIRPILK